MLRATNIETCYVKVPFDGPVCPHKLSPGQSVDLSDRYVEGLSERARDALFAMQGLWLRLDYVEDVSAPEPVGETLGTSVGEPVVRPWETPVAEETVRPWSPPGRRRKGSK